MKNSSDTIGNRTRDLLLYVVSLNLETSGTYDGPNQSSQHPYALTYTHHFAAARSPVSVGPNTTGRSLFLPVSLLLLFLLPLNALNEP